jgi:Tol biopolymer transport system component
VAVAVMDQKTHTRDLWMYDTTGGVRKQFTFDPAEENWLIFSPDGARVAVNAFGAARSGLFVSPAASVTPRETVLTEPSGAWPVSWSPDGKSILFVSNSPKTGNDIWTLPLSGDRKPIPFEHSEASENWAAFSPDGRWVAFSSTATSDTPEVYVTRFPNPGRAWRVSADGGTQARWRRDGKEILYVAPDRTLMAAAITLETDTITLGTIQPLFRLAFPYGAYHGFDVAANGRLLVNTSLLSGGTQQQASAFVERGDVR